MQIRGMSPSQVSLQVKNLLKIIWKQKLMIPRVQTFAWRLIRKALPTGLRAGRFSIHISELCCRCGQQENEIHLFFLCDFARAAWFGHPWYIRSDVLIQSNSNMHNIILALLNMNHPHASISNILNFMWCLWKARNDYLFDRKKALPHHTNRKKPSSRVPKTWLPAQILDAGSITPVISLTSGVCFQRRR